MVPAAGRSVQRGSTVTLRVASWDSRLAPKKRDDQTGEKSAGGARVTIVEPGTDPEKGVVAANDPKTPPAGEKTPPAEAKKPAPARKKIANIRYQAPPVKNQTLVIEIVDKNGERRLLSRKVNAGENIRLKAPYEGEAVVTIYLGGNFVWQDRYK